MSRLRNPCAAGAVLTAAVLLVSCGRTDRDSAPTATATAHPGDSTTGTVSGVQGGLTISEGAVGPVQLGMSRAELISRMGKPDADDAGTLKYFSHGMELFVTKTGVQKVFLHARTPDADRRGFNNYEEFKGVTDKGIRVGSRKDDVRAVYGEPTSETTLEGEENWNFGEQGITFTFDKSGSLRAIGVGRKRQ